MPTARGGVGRAVEESVTVRRTGRFPSIAVVMLVLSASACGSLLNRDVAPPAGLIAKTTPWAGVFNSVDLPLPVNALTAVSCPTPSACWATGSTVGGAGVPNGAAIVVTRDGGASWKSQAIPGVTGYLSSISCRDAAQCVAAGQTAPALGMQGLVLVTTNGGRAWTALPPLTGTTDVTAVTCLPNGRCLGVATSAVGAVAVTSSATGQPWQVAGPLPAGTSGATDLSCADNEHCWVTGETTVDVDHVAGSVAYTVDFGGQWTAVPLPPGTGTLNGVSCLGMSGATGSLPFGTTAAPGAPAIPSTAVPASTAPTPAATSTTTIPTTTTTTVPGVPGFACTVVGTTATVLDGVRTGRGIILTSDSGGSSWTARPVPPTAASFNGISCPANGSCVVVGTTVSAAPEAGLIVLTGNGSDTWKHAAAVPVPLPIATVSCASLGHCVMAGETVSERLNAS